jgi:predicted HAD superfamily Cof-like phosphohydrolase
MKKHIEDLIVEFNRSVLSLPLPKDIELLDAATLELSITQLKEEIDEYTQANGEQNVIGSIDAIIDLIYFSIGILYKHGLDAESINACITAVHNCNMQKKLGVKSTRIVDGNPADAVKPADWIGPEVRIAEILGL